MSATDLLMELTGQGVQLWVEGERLRARAPEGVLTDEVRRRLAEHKEALLALLLRPSVPPGAPDSGAWTIVPDPDRRGEPFPLTDIQQAYLAGRGAAYALGGVACHACFELESRWLDLARLQDAWNRLVGRHGMLRAIVLADGTQRILDQVPAYEIAVQDLRGCSAEETAARLEAVREELAHQVRATDRWPLFDLRASRFDGADGERIRVHVNFEMLVLDAAGIFTVFSEWSDLYREAEVAAPPEVSFRDYVLAELSGRESEEFARAERYWLDRLATLPPPAEPPFARGPAEIERPRFVRRKTGLDAERWARCKSRAALAGLTPSGTVCAVFAEVLAAWSKSRHFTLTVPLFLRPPGVPELERVLGDFTSTVLLEVEDAPGGFEARALRLQERLAEDLEHARVSGVHVLREQSRRGGGGDAGEAPPAAVFTSLLGHRAFRDGAESPTAWLGELVWGISQTPQVWLDLHVSEERGALLFNWDVVEELLPAGVLDDMWGAFRGLLERLADEESAWSERPLLLPAAQLALYAEANATAAPVPSGLLHEPFARRALEHPDAVAVVAADRTLTYRELWQRANALAWQLREMGARPNRLVALVMEKGWEQVAGALGVLGAGAAYLPVSPELPAERLRWLLEHGEVELALTQPRLDAVLDWPEGVRRLCVDSAAPPERPALPAVQGPDDIAYVIYTSGSTGTPKGVVIDHRGALNTVADVNGRFGVGPDDRVLALSSLSFDLSVYDVFGLLAAGGALVLPEPWADRDPARWLEWLRQERVTVWNTVPTLMEMLVEYAAGRGEALPESLRLVMLSGDWIPLTLPDRIRGLAPQARVISLGGATEASIWSILHPIERVEEGWRSVPYGRAMVNQAFHVLDEALEPRPVWVPGPLFIGGIGLAQGYWRDEERTRASFMTHPRTGERLYRTGDLGRWLPDGNIEFLGREDDQVKVQGHRIELGEIEAALLRHPEVRAAVVTVAGDPRGSRRLIAYVVGNQPRHPEAAELLDFLSSRLPAAMLPAEILHLEALPLTANGKVDRRALPAPGADSAQEQAAFTPARTPLERQLATIWGDVLGLEAVGIHDDFLRLGGNSLMAIRLYTRLRQEIGVEMPLRTLLRAGTVARLAETVAGMLGREDGEARREEPLPAIVPDPAQAGEPFPLTDIQQAYWIGRSAAFELGNVAPHAYMELEGAGIDVDRFQAAWRRLIRRHGMLRAVVLPDGLQQVLEEVPDYVVETLDLRASDAEETARELAALRERMSHQVLAVDRWPLFEIRATRLPGDRVRLHISLDLLVGDAWSMVLLVRELTGLYEDPATELPALDLSFRDYVMTWQELERSALYERSLEHWRRRLDDLPPAPDLPLARDPGTLDHPRFVRRTGTLEPAAWRRLQEGASRSGLTPSSLLLAAFAEVLTGWSKSPRFTLNTTLFNRLPLHPQVEQVVGDFTSMILLEVDNSGSAPFAERAGLIQDRLWEELDHRYVSGVRVLRELARLRGERAAMPVVFTSTLIEGNAGDRSGLQWFRIGEPVYSVSQTPQVWLDHQVFEEKGALLFHWDAIEELFPAGLLDDLWTAYGELLRRLADDAAAWTGRPALTPAGQVALYAEANATAAPLPTGLLHAPFERRVLERPDSPAVVAGELTLTYRELWQRANALAWELRELGARPNRLVAVVMEKGWEQVVAVLGVLGAGAAYLPVSPDQPAERLRWMLEHGEVELAVTQPRLAGAIDWPERVRRLTVERDASGLDRPALPVIQTPEDIAYVIYTSGSTGRPKGVVIDHRSALNTVVDVNERFAVGPEDRVLALSSLSFDLSVYDVFGLLAAGGALVLPEPWAGRDPSRWLEWLRQERVTVWNTVPTLMEMLVEHATGRGESLPVALRLVMLSGDWIPLTLPERIRSLTPGARVISLGGATEASIWSILYPIDRVEEGWRSVPYGRAMVNQSFHVLDEALEPRPVWVPGSLYIGGIGLAREYWRDEERTRGSFVTHPRTGERLYRTGDLGRWLPDGNIEFLGREDFQVKVQGHRIELGEVEAALLRHAEVRSAVVAVTGDPRGSRRLVAYVVREKPAAPAPAISQTSPAAEVPAFGDGALNDPLERLEFKLSKPHLRAVSGNGGTVRLARPEPEAASAWVSRRSHRAFRLEPLPLAAFGRFLGCLHPLEVDGLAKYRYPSAGSLYPVQVYLHVKPGRIEGVAGGTYYHHPVEHTLVPLSRGAELDASIHAPVNRPAFEGAAFSVFLIGQLKAIAPLYGSLARDFCLLEAGGISQLLMTAAAENGIGLCPIGGYDVPRVHGLLALDDGHIPLHSLVGGAVDAALGSAVTAAAGTGVGAPAAAGPSPFFEDTLREHLGARLPDYMIPSLFIELDALPLTANGKVDRRRLPVPEAAAEERAEPVAPRTDLERRLTEVLRELLGVERVGVLDSFFHLGATSVHMVQLNNRLRTSFGREMSIVDMFRFSNVATLAAHLATLPDAPAGPTSLNAAESRAAARREEMARRRGARRGGARGASDE